MTVCEYMPSVKEETCTYCSAQCGVVYSVSLFPRGRNEDFCGWSTKALSLRRCNHDNGRRAGLPRPRDLSVFPFKICFLSCLVRHCSLSTQVLNQYWLMNEWINVWVYPKTEKWRTAPRKEVWLTLWIFQEKGDQLLKQRGWGIDM